MKKLLFIIYLLPFFLNAQLRSNGGTGTGVPVYNTSPTLVTPALGTPASGNFSTGSFTWPTFNQNTSGSAATLTTSRNLYGFSFNGSAATVSGTDIIASGFGGTGNGFTKFTGPATSEKTFTLPNATATILTDNALVTAAQGGTGNGFFAVSGPATSTKTFTFPNASATVLTDNAVVTAAQGGTGINNSTRTLTINTNAGTIAFPGSSTTQTFPGNTSTVVGQVATADIAATASATSTTTLFTPTADGMYRIACYMKITTTGTSPVAGPVTITYTDADGSVAQSHTMLLASVTGTVVTTTVNNSTTTGTVTGTMIVNAKSGVAIQYAIAVSGTFGAGRYTAHFTCERVK